MVSMTFSDREKFLCLFAHPDDDVFVAGTMKLLLDKGADLTAAWLTSGDYFGLGKRRERELSKAIILLGLDESRVHLLKFPDLGLLANLDPAADRVADLMRQIQPSIVVANAFEGGHPDHDCVNFLAYEASFRAGINAQIIEFPLYNGAGHLYHCRWRVNRFPSDDPPTQYSRLSDDAVTCKHRIIRTYSSQWMFMFPARLATPRSRMTSLGEPYRVCPMDRDHTVPPHAGRLSYERLINSFMKTNFARFSTEVAHVQQRPLTANSGSHLPSLPRSRAAN
ncbi:MAG: PIG-L family deacetylase [Desulfomonile tiedjei]|nr:PIG-L family deacetylase [Desulfomonile tiedjei]